MIDEDLLLGEPRPQRKPVEKKLSEETLGLFAQDSGYVERWRPRLAGEAAPLRMNLYAAIFAEIWCVYRKLPWVAAVLFTLSLLVGATAYLLAIYVLGLSPYDTGFLGGIVALSVCVFVRIPFGFFADGIYYRKAVEAIARLADSPLPNEYFVAGLKADGGVDLPLAFGVAFAIALVNSLAKVFLR